MNLLHPSGNPGTEFRSGAQLEKNLRSMCQFQVIGCAKIGVVENTL
jgi:hypothetical protein